MHGVVEGGLSHLRSGDVAMKTCPFLREDWTCEFSYQVNRKVGGHEGIIPFLCTAFRFYEGCEFYIRDKRNPATIP